MRAGRVGSGTQAFLVVEPRCAGGGAAAFAWVGGEYDQGPAGQDVAGGCAQDRIARAAADFTKVALH